LQETEGREIRLLITQENLLKYWLEKKPPLVSEEEKRYRMEGFIYIGFDRVPFPDLQSIPAKYQEAYCDLIRKNPDLLYLISAPRSVQ
jgi:hypothetical protein